MLFCPWQRLFLVFFPLGGGRHDSYILFPLMLRCDARDGDGGSDAITDDCYSNKEIKALIKKFKIQFLSTAID